MIVRRLFILLHLMSSAGKRQSSKPALSRMWLAASVERWQRRAAKASQGMRPTGMQPRQQRWRSVRSR